MDRSNSVCEFMYMLLLLLTLPFDMTIDMDNVNFSKFQSDSRINTSDTVWECYTC